MTAGLNTNSIIMMSTTTDNISLHNRNILREFILKRKYQQCSEVEPFIKKCKISKSNFNYFIDNKTNSDDDEYGIPWIIKQFEFFDPVNTNINTLFVDTITPTLIHYKHLQTHLDHKLVTYDTLKNLQYECFFHATVSFVLMWDSYDGFINYFPHLGRFTELIKQEVTQTPILVYNKIPFIKTSFKIFTKFLRPENIGRDDKFSFIIPVAMRRHFERVYSALRSNRWTNELEKKCSNFNTSPLKHVAECYFGKRIKVTDPIKFITGTACVGKTTLASKLSNLGYRTLSRGDLGTFGGKSHSPCQIAGLHAALEILRLDDCIGDRGPIDNPLWEVIMELVDPIYDKPQTWVSTCLRKISQFINEPTLCYFMMQKGVVLIETNPIQNKMRMLNRAEGNDIHRSKIDLYVVAQSMAYYIVAVLFEWKIIFVPYENGRFSPYKYDVSDIVDYFKNTQIFGKPAAIQKAKKPHIDTPNMNYAKSIGIFK